MDKNKEIYNKIEEIIKEKGRAVVAIDGRAASGKTTLSASLAEHFGGDIVHADDFFLPFDMRTEERLSEPGGNVHYERLMSEVVEHLAAPILTYGVFDCSEGKITSSRQISTEPLLIVEGAYSMHPKLGRYYDLALFMTADIDSRLDRVRRRSNEAKAEIFKNKWMPLEEKYISTYKIRESADMIITTDCDEK